MIEGLPIPETNYVDCIITSVVPVGVRDNVIIEDPRDPNLPVLFKILVETSNTNPLLGYWVFTDGVMYWESLNCSGPTAWAHDKRRIMLRKPVKPYLRIPSKARIQEAIRKLGDE
jgi:hypothetical protein